MTDGGFNRGVPVSSGSQRLFTLQLMECALARTHSQHPSVKAAYGRLLRAWSPERIREVRLRGLDEHLNSEEARRGATRIDQPGYRNRTWRRVMGDR